MTARWVVDVVAPERDLEVTWQPISLLFKNNPAEDSEYYPPVVASHRMLRVQEAIQADADRGGNSAVFDFYWECARRIHHDEVWDFDLSEALEAAGVPGSFAAAADDEDWDKVIESKMQAGLGLVGEDVGTPIIAFETPSGPTGIFGPVITRKVEGQAGLDLWDAMVTMTTTDGFWELKRTRTERPDFGDWSHPAG